MKTKYIAMLALTLGMIFMACGREEFVPYDQPFIHINHLNSDKIQVQANRIEEVNYKVFLSSKLQYEPTQVTFEVSHGAVLALGKDYEVLTSGNTLTFAPGIFEMPIRIKWLRNAVDPTQDNTVVIRLTGNDRGFVIGMPGPDKIQSALTITKF